MRFAHPWVLALLAALPALGLLLWAARAARRRRLARFTSPELAPRLALGTSRGRALAGALLRLGAIGFVIVALARPQWGRKDEPVVRRGVDVVFALDLSASMLAEDVSPSRLEQARADAVSLLESLEGDRVGLVVFGGRAALQCPLTMDYGAVRMFLDAAEADFVPGPGTDLGRAVEEASRLFKSSERRYKTIVLFTDGEDLEGHGAEAVKKAREEGIVIHAVGVGLQGGGPIPLRGENGTLTGYKKDRQGRVVTTRFDPAVLEKITSATEGIFLHAGPVGEEGRRIAEAIAGMEKREIASRLATRYEDRYQIPLAVGLLLLCAEAFLIGRRVKAPPAGARSAAAAASLLAAFGLLFVQTGQCLAQTGAQQDGPAAATGAERRSDDGSSRGGGRAPASSAAPKQDADPGKAPREERPVPAQVARRNRDGNHLYSEKKYAGALQRYEEASAAAPDLPSLRYNIGNALYREEKYDAAASEYARALSRAGAQLSPAARYNLGNAEYAQGHYDEAAEAYGRVLEQSPQDEAARRNLELALRMLKKQREQQQKQDPSNQDKQKDQQKQQGGAGNQQPNQDQKEKQQQSEQEQQTQRPGEQDPKEGRQPSEGDRDRARGKSSPAGEGKIGKKDAEKLLDSLAQEEKSDMKKRLARLPQDEGPEKDW